jgi:Flp pilus assembly protein TadG
MRLRRSRGQSLVEFALTLPVLFMLICGVIEGGRLVYTVVTLDFAVQEGTRYATLPTTTSIASVQDYVANRAQFITVTPAHVTVEADGSAAAYPTRTPGARVVVTTSYTYTPLIAGMFGLNLNLNLSARSDGRAE